MATIDGSLITAGTISGTKLKSDANIPNAAMAQRAFASVEIPWTSWRVWNALGTNLPGTAAADDLGLIGGTFGTNSPSIQSSDGAQTTITQYARCTFVLPANYEADESVRLRFHCAMQTISDSTATLDVEVYEGDNEKGISSDICATAVQSINSASWTDYDFDITDTNLTAGDILDIRITVAITDSATGSGVIADIGRVELLVDTRGG